VVLAHVKCGISLVTLRWWHYGVLMTVMSIEIRHQEEINRRGEYWWGRPTGACSACGRDEVEEAEAGTERMSNMKALMSLCLW
jgi:hypothetical protein